MGNCCGGSLSEYDDNASGNVPTIELDNNALELDNNGSSSSGVPSINVVERKGKVETRFGPTPNSRISDSTAIDKTQS
ncbi:hypothetical protein CTI12_AA399210 [Artemisia annua]|uniref:Uncharacterized protein n=1 Tax=Artemisia annua TaxID=35608 RepID=A0A2U1MCB0_ARTAN|nr:hypothetical protein CTI12_AA399210 [Artemisia annua]